MNIAIIHARNYKAEISFMRPKELADDHTATVPVIAHASSEVLAYD